MGAVTHEVGDWLDALGLGQYAQVFAENGIDFDVLPDLTDRDLEKLGVLLGHRRKMLRGIELGRQCRRTHQIAKHHRQLPPLDGLRYRRFIAGFWRATPSGSEASDPAQHLAAMAEQDP